MLYPHRVMTVIFLRIMFASLTLG